MGKVSDKTKKKTIEKSGEALKMQNDNKEVSCLHTMLRRNIFYMLYIYMGKYIMISYEKETEYIVNARGNIRMRKRKRKPMPTYRTKINSILIVYHNTNAFVGPLLRYIFLAFVHCFFFLRFLSLTHTYIIFSAHTHLIVCAFFSL